MADENKTETTEAPSGLAITREANKFTCEWKIGDEDYDKGQQFEYKINSGKWTKIDIGKAITSKAVTVTMSGYYPTTSTKLTKFSFRVRGKRKPSSKTSSKKTINYTYDWSAWSEKSYTVKAPKAPELVAELSEDYYNVTSFSWETDGVEADDPTWFTDVVYQTILVSNCNSNGDKQTWSRSNSGWGTASGLSATGSTSKTETLASTSKTRFFRAKSRGPAGDSKWVYAKHVYARPQTPTISSLKVKKNTGGYQVGMKWKAPNSKANPVDLTVIQSALATPAAGMECPNGAVWTDLVPIKDTEGKTTASFITSENIGVDQVLFLRVMSEHDPYDTSRAYSTAETDNLLVGDLTAPTNLSVTLVSGRKYTVAATNNSSVPGSYLVVATRGKTKSTKLSRKGTIPAGSSSVQITVGKTIKDAFQVVVFAEAKGNGVVAKSDQTSWDSSQLPTRPTGLSITKTNVDTVQATWTNTWDDMDGSEISWSQDENAWESTNEPESYTINTDTNTWYINGLAMGTWYFRVRSFGEDEQVTEWSKVAQFNLAETPQTPILTASTGRVGRAGSFKVSWTYGNSDGSAQSFAQIVTGVSSGGSIVPSSNIVASVESSQSATIYVENLLWTAGEHTLFCKVFSASGMSSDWSNPVVVTVVDPPTATITTTNLSNVTVRDSDNVARTVTALTAMPLTLTVTGADAGGITTVSVERAETYHMNRPDGDTFDGFEGETIAIVRQTGDSQISVNSGNMLGRFDDGAKYRIVAEVTDSFGQTARATKAFEVRWSHQAIKPSATVVIDETALIAKITPVKPSGASNNDVCDIYRLSADKPELIYEGAAWSTTYVDPYPAFGEYGGHRVVLRTANGDYITSANQPAWRDYDEGDDDIIEMRYPATVIDFDGEKAYLQWNMEVSSNWEKDFTETKYLGGAVQGDWNAAVSRTSSVSATVVNDEDPELIRVLRRLADYAGICHIRTPEGSSFAADVQVSETSGAKLTTFDLTITRVDPEGFDGMTLTQWEEEAE